MTGEADSWNFGVGAGFYVDATAAPWAGSYHNHLSYTISTPSLRHLDFYTYSPSLSLIPSHTAAALFIASWTENYRMYSYITKELMTVLKTHFPSLDLTHMGITGH